MYKIAILGLLAVLSVLLPFVVTNVSAESTAPELPKADDLSALAEVSNQQHLPILLMYSAEDCEYCELLENDIIRPMMLSGELGKKVVFRKVMVDSFDAIKDFRGQRISPDEFAYAKGVQVTPTLQFVDENGEELVPKLIGYQGNDFFGAYLDTAISGSKEILLKK
jgi:thioredoxin-related protein